MARRSTKSVLGFGGHLKVSMAAKIMNEFPTAIARWEDSGTSVDLSRSESLNAFELTVFSKRLEMKSRVATAEALKLEQQEAPQKEIDRQKSEADKLEVARQKNIKAFRF